MTPRLVGLTGNIGSGKSTVARMLVARGAALVDADALARAATEDAEVLRAIEAALGDGLVIDGSLDRRALASRVFGDAAALSALNAIVHPWVRSASAQRVAELQALRSPPPVILLDIPLLYENGLDRGLDAVIVVDAPLELRSERVQRRSGLEAADVRARDAAQMPLAEKRRRADFVLSNAGTEAELESQIATLWPKLRSLAASPDWLP